MEKNGTLPGIALALLGSSASIDIGGDMKIEFTNSDERNTAVAIRNGNEASPYRLRLPLLHAATSTSTSRSTSTATATSTWISTSTPGPNHVTDAATLGQAGTFEPSSMFVGMRPGKVFKTGPLGVGYYPDMNAYMCPHCLARGFSDTELRLHLGAFHPAV